MNNNIIEYIIFNNERMNINNSIDLSNIIIKNEYEYISYNNKK